MATLHILALLAASTLIVASFHAFDEFDESLRFNFGISAECMTALNTTVDCHKEAADLAAIGVDYNWWHQQDVIDLCTNSCKTSLNDWLSLVETACATETINQAGTLAQAKIIPLQYTYGYSVACLKDTSSKWCQLESQEWEGSDYIRYEADYCADENQPEICNDPDFDISQIDPDMKAIPMLYEKTIYCSECFLKLWRQRLLSPFLPQSNHTEYLIEQFEYMQGNCTTVLPYTTSSPTLFVGTPTATTTSIAPNIAPTCTGQIIQPQQTSTSCNGLSELYGVSTGDLRVATGDEGCHFDKEICFPPPCPLETVRKYGATCDEYAAKLSNSTHTITPAIFFGWNQNIVGSCDYLAMNQRLCVGPPGGSWTDNGAVYAPTATSGYYTTATPAAPTQTGSVAACGRYYTVVAGDTCNQIALVFGITFHQLQTLNTYLNTGCTNLWLGYSVCVAPVTPEPVSTNGLCGPGNNFATCAGSEFGSCCSTSGYCGDTSEYCSPGNCYSGACDGPGGGVTTDGSCGVEHGDTTCDNPLFGPCCSIYGYCGSGKDYCGAGNCHSGDCDTDIGGPSINGECGPLFAGNKTCTGTQFGTCCSVHGYCGSTSDYCGGDNCYSGACT